jgi:hypothetical protein
LAEQSLTHTTDARLLAEGTKTHTTDARLELVLSREHTTDALLEAETAATHTTDARLYLAEPLTHTTDARLYHLFKGTGVLIFPRFLLSGSGNFYAIYRTDSTMELPGLRIYGVGVNTPPAEPSHIVGPDNRKALKYIYGWGRIDLYDEFNFEACRCEGCYPEQEVSAEAVPTPEQLAQEAAKEGRARQNAIKRQLERLADPYYREPVFFPPPTPDTPLPIVRQGFAVLPGKAKEQKPTNSTRLLGEKAAEPELKQFLDPQPVEKPEAPPSERPPEPTERAPITRAIKTGPKPSKPVLTAGKASPPPPTPSKAKPPEKVVKPDLEGSLELVGSPEPVAATRTLTVGRRRRKRR